MRTKRALGFVWIAADGGWKHGEHLIRKGLKGWTVVLGPYAGTGHDTLTEAMYAVGGWILAKKRLEAEEAREFEEAFGEMLSEREVRERDGYELAMHYLYESLKAQGKVE
jgi:hypothetical protein